MFKIIHSIIPILWYYTSYYKKTKKKIDLDINI